jgi:hypothetical protein
LGQGNTVHQVATEQETRGKLTERFRRQGRQQRQRCGRQGENQAEGQRRGYQESLARDELTHYHVHVTGDTDGKERKYAVLTEEGARVEARNEREGNGNRICTIDSCSQDCIGKRLTA